MFRTRTSQSCRDPPCGSGRIGTRNPRDYRPPDFAGSKPLYESGKTKAARQKRNGETNRKQNCPTRTDYECPTHKSERKFNMIGWQMVPRGGIEPPTLRFS